MRFAAGFLLTLLVLAFGCPALHAAGLVDGFNVVSLGNFSGQNSDLQGTLAVGGNLTLQSYSLNRFAPVPNTVAGGFDTVVGGNLSFTNGQVYGNVHSTSASFSGVSVCPGCSVTGPNSPVDFAALAAGTQATNSFLYQLSPTGTTTMPYGTLMLNASGNSSLQVFSLTAAQLSNDSGINITNLAAGVSVVINITDDGSHAATTSAAALQINNTQPQAAGNVVFNFASTITSISIANSFYASILAPYANVTGTYGAFNGDLVAASYNGNNQFNLDPFTGSLPTCTTPEPASVGMFACASLAGLGWGLFRLRREKRRSL